MEQSLSVDNLFVFVVLFEYFKVRPSVRPSAASPYDTTRHDTHHRHYGFLEVSRPPRDATAHPHLHRSRRTTRAAC